MNIKTEGVHAVCKLTMKIFLYNEDVSNKNDEETKQLRNCCPRAWLSNQSSTQSAKRVSAETQWNVCS